jgi:hypothetical protein
MKSVRHDHKYTFIGLQVKYPLLLPDFNNTWIFRILRNSQLQNFMKFHPVRALLFHADRHTYRRRDGNDEAKNYFSQFYKGDKKQVIMSKNNWLFDSPFISISCYELSPEVSLTVFFQLTTLAANTRKTRSFLRLWGIFLLMCLILFHASDFVNCVSR